MTEREKFELWAKSKQQKLTVDRVRELLSYNPDTGVFTWKSRRGNQKAGSVAGSIDRGRYSWIKIDGENYAAHRIAWLYTHGGWPENCIDHINGICADNRIENLRDVSVSVNMQNMRRPPNTNKTSGLLGVSWFKPAQKWRAQIRIGADKIFLGHFGDKYEAHKAYLSAKRRYHEGCTI